MLRAVVFVAALAVPAVALAQQPCTTDARYVVDQVYRAVLERGADQNAASQVRQLQAGTVTVKDIVRELVKSAEHTSRFAQRGDASANQRTVTNLYRHILGREPDPGGLQAHLQGLSSEGLEAVITAILESPEYQENYGEYGVPRSAGLRYCERAAAPVGAAGSPGLSGLATDANRDGRIDRWEWNGTWQAFDAKDRNGDGTLTGDELQAVGTSGYQDPRFARLDRNGDGRIQRNEWDGSAAQFNRLDVNRNNLLEPEEVAGASTGSEVTFSSLDRNQDNRITIEEWNWNRRSFNQQDTDGDGAIMPWEFTGAPAGRRR